MACSAGSLSNRDLHPDFIRLGVKASMAKVVMAERQQMFSQVHIAIVPGDPAVYSIEAAECQKWCCGIRFGQLYAFAVSAHGVG